MIRLPSARSIAAAALAASLAFSAIPASAQNSYAGMSTTGAYLAGRSASMRLDLASAAQFYRIVFDRNPSDYRLAANILSLWVEAGDVSRAVPLANAVIAADPGYEPARLVLAAVAFADQDYGRAEVQASAIAGDQTTATAATILKAWAQAGLGDVDDALATLAATSQSDLLSAFHASLIADMAGRTDEAIALLEPAFSPQSSQRLVEAFARELARGGRTGDAIQVLMLYLQLSPDHPTLTPLLEQIRAGDPIAPMIETARQGAAELFYGIASSLVAGDDYDTAIVYLQLARHVGQNGDFGILLLAQIFQAQQRHAEAVRVFDTIGSDSPLYLAAAVGASISDQIRGESESAITRLRPIVAANPGEVNAASTLADVYRSLGRFEEAQVTLSGVIDSLQVFITDDWQLFFGRGIAYERMGEWPSAEADFRRALALSPDQPDVLNYLGYSWVDRGENYPEAFDMINRAVQQRPNSGEIVDSLGWAYYRLGDYETAAATLERAVALVPYQPEILDHLGDAYWRVGRRTEAVYQWNHALFFGADEALALIIQDKIDNGLPDVQEGLPAEGAREIR
jgi:tetratricopeptide (TPR) repeat protein